MLISGSKSYLTKFIPVRHARLIKEEINSTKKYKELLQKSEEYYEFKLTPFIWKRFFDDSKNRTDESLLTEILNGIKAVEEEYKEINKPVIGRKKLINSKINTTFKPKKNNPTPYIICSDSNLRITLIEEYKYFVKLCKNAYQELKKGVKNVIFPFGAYIPSSGLMPLHI
jgi:hypothetical protein